MSTRLGSAGSVVKTLGALALFASGGALQASVSVERSYLLTRESVTLPANSFSSYEYELQDETELIFILQTAQWRREPLRLWLLDGPNYRRMTRGLPFDYVERGTGLVDRRARISYTVAEGGTYHLVLDNSETASAREIDVHAYVRTLQESRADALASLRYQGYYDALSNLVDIGGIDVQVRRCGEANAFTVGTVVVICRELDEFLSERAPPGVPLFVFLHEISHRLIASWGYQSIYANQPMVDRLAVTLFSLMDDGSLAGQAAEWFLGAPSELREEVSVDTFSLRRSRSRQIASWLVDERDLNRGWTRRIVVPRMSTSALKSLVDAEHIDARTRKRMRSELSARLEGL